MPRVKILTHIPCSVCAGTRNYYTKKIGCFYLAQDITTKHFYIVLPTHEDVTSELRDLLGRTFRFEEVTESNSTSVSSPSKKITQPLNAIAPRLFVKLIFNDNGKTGGNNYTIGPLVGRISGADVWADEQIVPAAVTNFMYKMLPYLCVDVASEIWTFKERGPDEKVTRSVCLNCKG